jgi:hypothetical protein
VKETAHLDIRWLVVDEEIVTDNNTRRESKAKSKETKHRADYAHL